MSNTIDLSYPSILEEFGPHLIEGRLESRAFLGWFLEHYYRLDEIDAQDAICDGPYDRGIDGIYVNHNFERIDVFQTKLFQNSKKTLGDVALKEFAGTLGQFATEQSINQLIQDAQNSELRGLLVSQEVARLVGANYDVRGVFVTNATKDPNADSFLKVRPDITVMDGNHLLKNWVAPGDSSPVESTTRFSLDGLGLIRYRTADAEVVMAPLLATELIQLAGLESQELFAWNVRQTLGKTKVNKAIADSIKDVGEHKNFLFYHNGLTIVAESVTVINEEQLVLERYTVVNGCQSLSTLYENRAIVTEELRLLTRIIKLPPQDELAAKITRHSNNQNAISARDLQSNSTIQRRLQNEFRREFANEIGYEIKRGESIDAVRVVTNELAARLLLAFDLEQPWSCHQSYKLFDELHSDVFGRPEVDAYRIASLDVLLQSIDQALSRLDDQLVARYNLTRYFMLYLVKQSLKEDELGREFLQNTKALWNSVGIDALRQVFSEVVADLITDFGAELQERNESPEPFDHKRELKSPNAVRSLMRGIIPNYQKAIRRDRAKSFSDELRKYLA